MHYHDLDKLFLIPGEKCDQGFCYLVVCGTISVNGILKNHLRLLAHHPGDGGETQNYTKSFIIASYTKSGSTRLPAFREL